MFLRMIYDDQLAAATYLIGCQQTGEAILIDPERDIDRYIELAEDEGLKIVAVTETHIHADFLSGTREVAERTGATVYLSAEGGEDWSYQWLDKKSSGGSYPHVLLKDQAIFSLGKIEFKVIHTPGHTPEHLSFLVTDRGAGVSEPIGIVSGDFLFVGDLGRPDLLETAAGKKGAADSEAHVLYKSIQKIKKLPEFLQVWPAHGAGSACGKTLGAVPSSTIGYEMRFNQALLAATNEANFVNHILAGQPEPPLYFARMKYENRVGPKILGELPKPQRLTSDQLKDLNTKEDVIIDTRSWKEFSKMHISGSFFHPINRSFITDIGSMVGDDPNIFLVCRSNEVSTLVTSLVRIGLDKILGWIDPTDLNTFADSGGSVTSTKELRPSEVREDINSNSVHILDVRRSSEYQEGHISGSQHFVHTRLAANLDKIPTDKPILVHCRSGVRSSYACSLLERRGLKYINMIGGMLEWERSGLPVER